MSNRVCSTGVRGKKQSSPSAPAVLLLCCLSFLPFPNREGNRECSKSYHRNLSHIIKLFKVFLKFKTFYIVFVLIKKVVWRALQSGRKKILGLQLKITSKLQDKIYVLFLPLSSLAGRFCRPVFRARVSVRARARELKKERVAQPPVYTIVESVPPSLSSFWLGQL